MKTAITKESLLEFGMIQKDSPIYPLEKVISVDDNPNEGHISICVTHVRNTSELCLMMPDGACIYIGPESIEELKVFEKCILAWEPNY
jgi:guanylate kinase